MNEKMIKIKFGGNLHEIELGLLLESLTNYALISQEAARYISPNTQVNIKIQAPEKGSFLVCLNVIASHISDLFTNENISLVANICTIVTDIFQYKQWVSKNGTSETIRQLDQGKIEIKNNNGNIKIDARAYTIYQECPKVRSSLRRTFEKLKESEDITDFTIQDELGSEIFSIDHNEFELMTSEKDEVVQKKQIEIKENQDLSIFKVVFHEKYKWEFYYQGNKIYAILSDEEFFKKIEKGEVAFRSGDRLIANISIHQVFNEAANTFVNDSYEITKVSEHIPRSITTQPLLDFIDK